MVLIRLLRMGEEVIYLLYNGNLDILLASPRCIICDLFIMIINIIFQARERTPPLDRLIYPGMSELVLIILAGTEKLHPSSLQATPNVHLLKLNMLPTGMAWAGQRKEGFSFDEKRWGVKNLWRTIISSVGVFGLGPPQSFLPIGKWKIINVTNNQSRIGSLRDKTFDLM